MAIPVKNLNPYTISDVGLVDEDSGLRQFRGMITPWERIKSFRETVHFMWRHSALMGVGFMNAFKIIEPDYEIRQTTMSRNWGQAMAYMWSKEDPMGALKDFESRHDIPPFMKKSLYRSASYCDNGDEFTGMPGYIWYASNDRISKEVHTCPIDIIGPDACDLSNGGGQYFCFGCSGEGKEGMTCYLTQRKGCGDPYCQVLHESVEKYGPNKNADGFDWECWGPGATMPQERDQMPNKAECEWMHTGEFISPLNARWTAGEMFRSGCQAPLSYASHAAGGIRTLTKPEDMEKAMHVVKVVFETAGKFQFGEYNTRKEVREWLGVPAEINDGRVLAAYISMIQQCKNVPWDFVEFTPERCVVEVDAFTQNMYGQYPEFTDAYLAYFDGAAKTLIGTQWVVKLGTDAPEGKIHYVIEKGVYGYRRQKPGYTYADGEQPKE